MSTHTATRTFDLTDAAGRNIGHLRVESVENDIVLGDFDAGPDYAAVEPVFRHLSDVFEQQAFTYLDEALAAVARLGILARPDGSDAAIPVDDVQIYPDDDGASFRLPPAALRNGHA